jgi:hypothetical protein
MGFVNGLLVAGILVLAPSWGRADDIIVSSKREIMLAGLQRQQSSWGTSRLDGLLQGSLCLLICRKRSVGCRVARG